VLKDINLDVYPGQVIGYIGPNGAGKSTTVKILCGLLTDYEGSVNIKGLDLRTNGLAIKKMIGYVPELAELYEVLTPVEYLGFTAALYGLDEKTCKKKIRATLAAFGLEANADQRMDSFSKGMKQKVLLCSGLLHNPDIIILDEPLSGLDANTVIVIKDLIAKLAQEGKTIFYCSHMMDVVEKVSHRIVLIDGGQVIADGSFDQLRLEKGGASLEQIFSSLTSGGQYSGNADRLMAALDNLRNESAQ
jgi:ABC-2 type transport system ATP-binding protein